MICTFDRKTRIKLFLGLHMLFQLSCIDLFFLRAGLFFFPIALFGLVINEAPIVSRQTAIVHFIILTLLWILTWGISDKSRSTSLGLSPIASWTLLQLFIENIVFSLWRLTVRTRLYSLVLGIDELWNLPQVLILKAITPIMTHLQIKVWVINKIKWANSPILT